MQISPQLLNYMRSELESALHHGFIITLIACILGLVVSIFVGGTHYKFPAQGELKSFVAKAQNE